MLIVLVLLVKMILKMRVLLWVGLVPGVRLVVVGTWLVVGICLVVVGIYLVMVCWTGPVIITNSITIQLAQTI